MDTTYKTRAEGKAALMIQIDIVADLNLVDDEGRNLARRPINREDLDPGAVAVAGRPGFWSWVLIDVVEGGFIHFHQITAAEAATHGDLVDLPA